MQKSATRDMLRRLEGVWLEAPTLKYRRPDRAERLRAVPSPPPFRPIGAASAGGARARCAAEIGAGTLGHLGSRLPEAGGDELPRLAVLRLAGLDQSRQGDGDQPDATRRHGSW